MRFDKDFQPELCISKDTTRYDLTFVNLNGAKKRLEATDGHMACCIPCALEDGDAPGSTLLTPDMLKAARQVGKNLRIEAVTAVVAEKTVTLPGGQSFPVGRDVQFPDLEMVTPKFKAGDEGTVTIAFNAELLYRLAKAIGVKKGDGVVLTFEIKNNGGPILVKPYKDNIGSFGILMQMGLVEAK